MLECNGLNWSHETKDWPDPDKIDMRQKSSIKISCKLN